MTAGWRCCGTTGTPNLGPPPEPLLPAADRLGIRWVSYDRPGYGESTPNPGRAALVDHLSTTDFDPEQFTPADHAALVTSSGEPPGRVRPAEGRAVLHAEHRAMQTPAEVKCFT